MSMASTTRAHTAKPSTLAGMKADVSGTAAPRDLTKVCFATSGFMVRIRFPGDLALFSSSNVMRNVNGRVVSGLLDVFFVVMGRLGS